MRWTGRAAVGGIAMLATLAVVTWWPWRPCYEVAPPAPFDEEAFSEQYTPFVVADGDGPVTYGSHRGLRDLWTVAYGGGWAIPHDQRTAIMSCPRGARVPDALQRHAGLLDP